MDPIQSGTIENIFHQQLFARITEDADKNLMLFDRYVQIFHQNVRLIALEKEFYDYVREVTATDWIRDPESSDRIKYYTHYLEPPLWQSVRDGRNRIKSYAYYMEYPRWMPRSAALSSLPHFHYAILIDSRGNVREIYKNVAEMPPQSLLDPSNLPARPRDNSGLLTDIDGALYLVASEHLYGPSGELMSTLLLATPVDDDFLSYSQDKNQLVAFVEGKDRHIVASNRGDLLTAGTKVESLKDRYLHSGKSVHDYGEAGQKLELVVFVPRMPLEQMSKSILGKERGNRIITALLLILSFSLIMVWITRRIQSLTGRVLDFSQRSLQVPQKHSPEGDELKVLDECFRNLTNVISLSQESLRSHAEILQKERDMAQNYLDIAGTIILTLDSTGKITMINRKGCSLLGYGENEIIGKDWFENFVPERSRHEIRLIFGKIMAGESEFFEHYENTVLNRQGEERVVAWHNTVLKDEAGGVTGVLSSGEDVTEHKQLEKSLIEIEERERRRIGQDLHDGLGQLLTGIAFQVRGLGRKLEKNSFSEAEDAAEISVLVDDAKKQVSRISRGLYPVEVDKEGLTTALEKLAFYVRKTFGITCVFICNEHVTIHNKTAVLQLYRIAQEAVTNAVKHGRPKRIDISLSDLYGKVAMTVKDDGAGIPDVAGRKSAGMGLKIMDYRANLINAILEVRRNEDGGGTVIRCIYSDTDE